MHFNFPILIIVFPIFHNFFEWWVYYVQGVFRMGVIDRWVWEETLDAFSYIFLVSIKNIAYIINDTNIHYHFLFHAI